MIEEIKKEINKKVNEYFWKQYSQNESTFIEIKKIYNGVLDKYNNQSKAEEWFRLSEKLNNYKSAWEEFNKMLIEIKNQSEEREDRAFIYYDELIEGNQKLSKKYNLGDTNVR